MITIEKNLHGYKVVALDGVIIPHQTIHGLTIKGNSITVEAYIDTSINGSWTEKETKQASKQYWLKDPDIYSIKEIKTIRLYLDKEYYDKKKD